MKDSTILNIGKFMFWISSLLGNLCLFGYLFTKKDGFITAGHTLLILGSILNLFVVSCLLIFGLTYKNKLDVCLKSIGIMIINIPLAILYIIIGTNLTEI